MLLCLKSLRYSLCFTKFIPLVLKFSLLASFFSEMSLLYVVVLFKVMVVFVFYFGVRNWASCDVFLLKMLSFLCFFV